MKFFKTAFIAFITLTIFSCTTDSLDDTLDQIKIVGNWKLRSAKVDGKELDANCNQNSFLFLNTPKRVTRTVYTNLSGDCTSKTTKTGFGIKDDVLKIFGFRTYDMVKFNANTLILRYERTVIKEDQNKIEIVEETYRR